MNDMDQIRKACVSLEEGYMPPVTFILVQQRHHTRFFPATYGDTSGNIVPGTVVDTSICHPTQRDFYLCSHAAIKGSSRPTHYNVLYDESTFVSDDVHDFTNKLCYTCQRCSRSLSVVPPIYYAHLAAFRASYYMEDGESSDTCCSVPAIHENVKNLMFYI